MNIRDCLTGWCLLIPLFAPAQQANVNLDYDPQKNREGLVPFRAPLNFSKGENGIWSLTLGPLRADMYAYHLNVDGVQMADPNNTCAAFTAMPPYSELVGNIIPYVEANYRVSRDREKRAIAGFSRGGGQSLFTGFNNLDKFAWIGSDSAYLTPEVFDKYFPAAAADPESINTKLRLLWLGVGQSDFLYRQALEFDDYLKAKKIEHRTLVTEGGHTWMNARHYLSETLQLYFK